MGIYMIYVLQFSNYFARNAVGLRKISCLKLPFITRNKSIKTSKDKFLSTFIYFFCLNCFFNNDCRMPFEIPKLSVL